MGYIAILIALLIGGGVAYQGLVKESPGENPESDTNIMLSALDEAEEAKRIIEDIAREEALTEENANDSTDESEPDIEGTEELADNTSNEEHMTELNNNNNEQAIVGNTMATMLIAGGCFWCVEADVEKLPGVIEAVSGYAGGDSENPTYGNYYKGGHREVVEVTYNPSVVSFEEILIYALKHMDPTDGEGSFRDRGEYYSPAFYYDTDDEKELIEKLIAEVNEKGPYDKTLAIDVEARPKFWAAEDYHQDYYKGTLSALKYKFYRNASGRDDFIRKYWGSDTGPDLSWRQANGNGSWQNFTKPSESELRVELTAMQFKVTQEEGTEPAFNNEYWDNHEEGIYVDVVSGEPLFSSTHKFDSGTGWPSFTRPIDYDFVTEHKDYKLILPRTEIRSAVADSHLGHVFNDAPKELGGIRYCMNSASLRFIPKADMEEKGYDAFLYLFE